MLRRTCWRSGSPVGELTEVVIRRPLIFGFRMSLRYANVPWFTSISHHYLRVDVGGGAVKNETRNAIARIPLRWMVRQCFLADTGIMFNSKLLAKFGIDSSTLYPDTIPRPDPITFERADRSRITSDDSSRPGKARVRVVNEGLILTEEEEDLADILSPINDELSRSKSWWFLEIMPLKHRHQKEDGKWVWRTRYFRLYTSFRCFRPHSFLFSQAQYSQWEVHPPR